MNGVSGSSSGARELGRSSRHEVVPRHVLGSERHVLVGEPTEDHDVLDAGRLCDRLVRHRLHLNLVAAPVETVAGDQHLCARIVQARRDGRRAESREDRHVDRADLGDGVHRDHGLRDHRHVHADRIATATPRAVKPCSDPVDLGRELRIGKRARGPLLALPRDRGTARRLIVRSVTVDGVVGEVDGPSDEPSGPLRAVRCVQHLVVWLEEIDPQVFHGLVPEPLRLILGPFHERVEILEAVLAHQPSDVGVLDLLGGGFPDEVGHGDEATNPVGVDKKRRPEGRLFLLSVAQLHDDLPDHERVDRGDVLHGLVETPGEEDVESLVAGDASAPGGGALQVSATGVLTVSGSRYELRRGVDL